VERCATAAIAWEHVVLLSVRCRLTPTLSGIPKVQLRQITLSVNDLLLSCRTSYPLGRLISVRS
jgi:hypothetical protein